MTDQTKMTEEDLIELFREKGLIVDIGGCGCCGSPWIKVTQGQRVFEEDDVNIEMHEKDSPTWPRPHSKKNPASVNQRGSPSRRRTRMEERDSVRPQISRMRRDWQHLSLKGLPQRSTQRSSDLSRRHAIPPDQASISAQTGA